MPGTWSDVCMDMTKKDLMRVLGIDSEADLARYFNVTRSAVGQWKDVPELRLLQAQQRSPERFIAAINNNNDS